MNKNNFSSNYESLWYSLRCVALLEIPPMVVYKNGKIDAIARHRPIIGLYRTQANPIIMRLMNIEMVRVKDSIAINSLRVFECITIVLNIFARHVADKNSINQPKPL